MIQFYINVNEEKSTNKADDIWNKYGKFMIYIARIYANNLYTEEDIVQEAFVKILKNIDKININDDNKTKSFLRIIIKNAAIDMNRKHTPQTMDEEESVYEVASDENSPLDQLISKEGYENLKNCIVKLNDTYRDVCMLKYVNGLPEKEIAKILNLPLKTVNVRIFRGREKLRKIIEESRV